MHPFKARSKYRLTMKIELSFVRNTEATSRALLRNRARHGCVSLFKREACTGAAQTCAPRGVGRRVKTSSAGPTRGLSTLQCEVLANLMLAHSGLECGTDDALALDVLDFQVFTGVAIHGLQFDSRQTPNRAVRSRSWQNSFCSVPAASVISVDLAGDTALSSGTGVGVQPPFHNHVLGRRLYGQVECYFGARFGSMQPPGAVGDGQPRLAQVCNTYPSSDGEAVGLYALLQVLHDPRRQAVLGTNSVVTREPMPVDFNELVMVDVREFSGHLLQVGLPHDRQVLRFIECPWRVHFL